MQSDAESVRKSIRLYLTIGGSLLIFTAITVLANRFHFVVPIAIAVALVIAAIKGSMVASVFMHLNHEQRWIYGALALTVLFFIVLMCLPLFTTLDNIGTAVQATSAEHAGGH
jgi:cytochrome c oxidase subunit IV